MISLLWIVGLGAGSMASIWGIYRIYKRGDLRQSLAVVFSLFGLPAMADLLSIKRSGDPTDTTDTKRSKPDLQLAPLPSTEDTHFDGDTESKTPESHELCDQDEKRIKATLYGNCIGDAIGLLSEFMNKQEAVYHYGNNRGSLEYINKYNDGHRVRWDFGDWTDDSDQMLLIMRSLYENMGKSDPCDFGKKLKNWVYKGFPELGDQGGCGIGATTYSVISHKKYDRDPQSAALEVWERSGRQVAPNGAVMRTSVVGAYKFHDLKAVKDNTLTFCTVSHADPRCKASCVAVTTAIALMLQGQHRHENGTFDVDKITNQAFVEAEQCLDEQEHIAELKSHMYVQNIEDLKLDETAKIGYTYKCLGAGFWAFRQDDFRKALESIVFEAGDADTNGAVAGALLGCKLGMKGLPESWLHGLCNKDWLETEMKKFLSLVRTANTSAQTQAKPISTVNTMDELRNRIEATLYGNCIGDAIGLLSEFMSKEEAQEIYGSCGNLEYEHKLDDFHRSRWENGDWTDDSDQMILILRSLFDLKGKADGVDFGKRLKNWVNEGFRELGDYGGCGIGATTYSVISHREYDLDPAQAALEVWEGSGKQVAPNGAVMRTSVVGAYKFHDLKAVKDNTLTFCTVSHADPRCQASCVAVTRAIALMLQGKHRKEDGTFDAEAITDECYKEALKCLEGFEEHKQGLQFHMYAKNIEDLELDESAKIGYTYKCLGAGFWAFRQNDFRKALESIVFEAGDADTNGAVAGALLGCKLGMKGMPETWLSDLFHKDWLAKEVEKFIQLVYNDMPDEYYPLEESTSNPNQKLASKETEAVTDEGAAEASKETEAVTDEGAAEASKETEAVTDEGAAEASKETEAVTDEGAAEASKETEAVTDEEAAEPAQKRERFDTPNDENKESQENLSKEENSTKSSQGNVESMEQKETTV